MNTNHTIFLYIRVHFIVLDINVKGVVCCLYIFQLLSKSIVQPTVLSEMKDKFRGLKRSPLAPPEITVKAPDPEYISDVSMLSIFFTIIDR